MPLPPLLLGQRGATNVLFADRAPSSDAGTGYDCRAKSNRYAPGEESVFYKVYVTVTWELGATVLVVTPTVEASDAVYVGSLSPSADGAFLLAQTIVLPAVVVRTKREFEVPLVLSYRAGGRELDRFRPRGKWIAVQIAWPAGDPVHIEGTDIEAEVVQETIVPQSVGG